MEDFTFFQRLLEARLSKKNSHGPPIIDIITKDGKILKSQLKKILISFVNYKIILKLEDKKCNEYKLDLNDCQIITFNN